MRPCKVIGYFPAWTGRVDRIRFDKLTHVNYSFVLPTPEGGLSDVDQERLRDLAGRAHVQGVKACIAVGGWNDGDTSAFEAMAADRSARGRFLGNLLDFCARHDLDGVDIDWEYPKAHSAADYALMMRELSQALHAQGKLLTTCAIAMDDEYGAHIHPDVFACVDFVNIMAYDWHGLSHSSYAVAEQSLDYWLRRGCPPEKAMLGLPFYGRKPPAAYRDLVLMDPDAPRKDNVGEIFYNGIPTIRKKTELALRKGGGVLIWEITQDTDGETSLLGAIHSALATHRGR
jgi:chitinase